MAESSSKIFFSCAPPAAIMMFGAPAGGSARAVDVRIVEEVHAVDHDALFSGGRPLSILARSTTQTCFWMKLSLVLVGM